MPLMLVLAGLPPLDVRMQTFPPAAMISFSSARMVYVTLSGARAGGKDFE